MPPILDDSYVDVLSRLFCLSQEIIMKKFIFSVAYGKLNWRAKKIIFYYQG